MNHKLVRRTLTVCMAIIMLMCLCMTAYAEEAEEPFFVTQTDNAEGVLWTDQTAVDVFHTSYTNDVNVVTVKDTGSDKVFAPGTNGTYVFYVANNGELEADCVVTFSGETSPADVELPMHYRAKNSEGTWMTASATTWAKTLKGDERMVLQPGESRTYTIEWEWPYEWGNDAYDTYLCELAAAGRQLKVNIVIDTAATVKVEQLGSLTISKTVEVPEGMAVPATKYQFKLKVVDAEGNPVSGSFITTDAAGVSGTLALKSGAAAVALGSGDSLTIEGLPAGSTYTLTETETPGVTVTSQGETGEIVVDETAEAEFVNNLNQAFTELSVKKVWDDQDDVDKIRPDSVTVTLYCGTKALQNVTLDASNDWMATIGNLPRFDENGKLNVYSFVETNVPAGYTAIYSYSDSLVTVTNKHRPGKFPPPPPTEIPDLDVPLAPGLNMNEGDCLY